MPWRSRLIKPIARIISKQIIREANRPTASQAQIFQTLIHKAKDTEFGKEHRFAGINTYKEYKDAVPIRDYEGIRGYIDKIRTGAKDVLWPGLPKYFSKTSGTTSGVKYIPITHHSLPNHFNTARNALFHFYHTTGKGSYFDGKVIFLSGSPKLTYENGIAIGRLSGIVNHQVPNWLKTSQLPTWKTNIIEDWEEKLNRIVDETIALDMRLISGIPPWVLMYYEKLLEKSGKNSIKEIFPNYSMFVYGGVNFAPYKKKLEQLVGAEVDTLETYPASEGFIAFQDRPGADDLLLNTDSGIFFEFIPADQIFEKDPPRYQLEDVKLGVNYAIIINSNAGLWGYNIGDTVMFTCVNPYRLRVTGRIKHFISAFGEHVIGAEVDKAINQASDEMGINLIEYTVAPEVNAPDGGLPYHEWFIEFDYVPERMEELSMKIDQNLQNLNIYYKDLIAGNILRTLKITPLCKSAFRNYMASQGKLGGQNKVPRLSNDRRIADALKKYALKSVLD
ncbi:MAG: GH3 auxin-responsive promoter family protein [Bacteroidia bacterium]|nr:GH3 auxin-responsive promoter family protein [Bacteroidia bacterium]